MITSTTSTAPSGSALGAAAQPAPVAGGAMGKDQFMKLLIAQMQNQDPTNPMDGSQMAAQLAQFSSLEQLQNINSTLTGQQTSTSSLLGAMQASSAISTIGHTVVASGNGVQITNGSASGVLLDIPSATKSGTLHIYNSTGTEVGTKDLGALNAGKQAIDVSGASSGLPDGAYTYSVDAKDAAGTAVSVQTFESGKVDGISTSSNGIVVTAGGLAIPYANIVQIMN
jgi:flagellar basal-body rod modification protein FlgD